ncbi:MAG: hypothetical protein JJLCMIEE_00152 [Acidimicrobiales bacterium]|nr:hypothetical protein [Acidimicrobiales bacterium]
MTRRRTHLSRVAKPALILLVLALGAMWFYAFSGLARRDHVDKLDDSTFAADAEPVCAAALTELRRYPPSYETPVPAERAEVIDATTSVLGTMVSELRSLAPASGSDAAIVSAWLDDWQTYLEDRSAYAEELRGDPDAAFLVTMKGNRQITVPMDKFAEVNAMRSCQTPGDV